VIQRRRLRKRELAAAAVLLALAAAAAGSVRAHAAPLGPTRLYDSADVLHDTDTAPMTLETSGNPEYQNPKKAMLLSLLIPGLGEYSLGHRSRAYLFFGVEAATWITYATFHVQGADAKQSYKEWARLLAGVSERNDDNFYRTVGNYISSDGPFSANEQVRREARSRYPNDREAQEQYVQENGYFGSDAWTWESYVPRSES